MSTTSNNQLAGLDQFKLISKQQDEIVLSVIGNKELKGFEKAYTMAFAVGKLQELLNDQYMAPIMNLMGTRLGFLTDKDREKVNGQWVKGKGYPVDVVRNCVIEAVLKGLRTTGNEFNVIAGNCYVTKEGLSRLLNEYPGLSYSVVPQIKSMTEKSALVESKIKWTLNNVQNEEVVTIPLKIDAYTSLDAIIGKSKRKSYGWLMERLSGESYTDADVEDQETIIVENSTEAKVEKDISENANTQKISMKPTPTTLFQESEKKSALDDSKGAGF